MNIKYFWVFKFSFPSVFIHVQTKKYISGVYMVSLLSFFLDHQTKKLIKNILVNSGYLINE